MRTFWSVENLGLDRRVAAPASLTSPWGFVAPVIPKVLELLSRTTLKRAKGADTRD